MNGEMVDFILELIQAIHDRENDADDPYTLMIPTDENIRATNARLKRLAELSGIGIELLNPRIRIGRAPDR